MFPITVIVVVILFLLGFLGGVGTIGVATAVILASVIFWVVCGYAGGVIGFRKQAQEDGFCLGLLFGPFGVIAAGFLDNRPQCPRCGGPVDKTICPHCKVELNWATGRPLTIEMLETYKNNLTNNVEPPQFDEWGRPLQPLAANFLQDE